MTKTTKVIKKEVTKHEHSFICHHRRNDKSGGGVLDLLFLVLRGMGNTICQQSF